MEYKEAINWLFAQLPMFSRIGAAAYKPGLERSLVLAEYLGNPHKKLRAIHVAGTNGKGSVSNLVAATLQSQGYKTALYTSPHLIDFRERIRINGKKIPKAKVIEFVERWREGNYAGDKPSFFELTMMLAFEWFATENVDFAVIEVGMGGRLDSTNIITPLLSIITNISFDHTQFLGDTLPKIAAEKAGIIKSGIPVVIGEATGETESVFRNKAAEMHAPLHEAYRMTDDRANEALKCSLKGEYQKKNINTARVALDVLCRQGVEISTDARIKGFSEVESITGFMGRWTILQENPLVICDTGHNEAGLSYNFHQLETLKQERPECELKFVIGFVADKEIDKILHLFPHDAFYYVTQAQIPRALPWNELLQRCLDASLKAEGFPNVTTAYKAAIESLGKDDILYVGGSTFIVADLLASITDM